jgi:diacylglycerol kinase family enzyme
MRDVRPHPEFGDEKVLAVMSPSALIHFELFKRDLPGIFPGVQLIAPRDVAHLHELVNRSAENRRLVLAIGGDGTLHQCLRRLDLSRQVLGILPSGSGNDFASQLGFPRGGLDKAIAHLGTLRAKPTDCGSVDKMRYINSAGFGIDTQTLLLRQRTGKFWQKQYNLLFVRALAGMQPKPIRLSWSTHSGGTSEPSSETAPFFWVLGMNSPVIGGGTRIAPQATLEDGLIDMVCIRRVRKLELLRRMQDAIAGRHLRDEALTLFRQVESFTVEADEPLGWLALDGELVLWPSPRAEFRVLPRSLSFLR